VRGSSATASFLLSSTMSSPLPQMKSPACPPSTTTFSARNTAWLPSNVPALACHLLALSFFLLKVSSYSDSYAKRSGRNFHTRA